ncbi:hypothetical protein ACU5JM_00960 (plasmid) [Rhodococcus erythropolis]|uniref:hypothetical protein n=1 Tax=Rhodococcus erythropolis TaxID=1833 RepID=UPI00406BA09A
MITQHKAWIPVVITGLVIGVAFIAVYVGIQRAPAPHNLPLAVAGKQLSTALASDLGDAVSITQVSDIEEGAARVRNGDAVAVIGDISPTRLQFEYAGASGSSESGAARQLVAGFAGRTDSSVVESDIVPLSPYDSRGLAAFYVVFGVTLASFVLAQGLTAAATSVRLRHRIYAMAAFAVLIGLVAATIAGPIYAALPAPFLQLAVTLVLLSAASAFATKALGAWLGPPGIGLAVLLLTTVGNATSGATIGYDLLPGWARAVSAELPPGAAVRVVNDFGYYNGAHVMPSLLVLGVWIAVGLGLVLLRQWIAARNAMKKSEGASSHMESQPIPG